MGMQTKSVTVLERLAAMSLDFGLAILALAGPYLYMAVSLEWRYDLYFFICIFVALPLTALYWSWILSRPSKRSLGMQIMGYELDSKQPRMRLTLMVLPSYVISLCILCSYRTHNSFEDVLLKIFLISSFLFYASNFLMMIFGKTTLYDRLSNSFVYRSAKKSSNALLLSSRVMLKFFGVVLAIIFFWFTAMAAVNQFDQKASAKLQELFYDLDLKESPSFVYLWGISAPVGKDPLDYGSHVIRSIRHISPIPSTLFKSMRDPANGVNVKEFYTFNKCLRDNSLSHCLKVKEPFAGLAKNQILLDRYITMINQFDSFVDAPEFHLLSPVMKFQDLNSLLSLKLVQLYQQQRHEEMFELWKTNMEFLHNMATSKNQIVTKMLTAIMTDFNLRTMARILEDSPLLREKFRKEIKKLLDSSPYQTQMQEIVRSMLSWQLISDMSLMSSFYSGALYTFLPNATKNLFVEYYAQIIDAAADINTARESRKLEKESIGIKDTPYLFYNPSGKLIFELSTISFTEGLTKIQNVQALENLLLNYLAYPVKNPKTGEAFTQEGSCKRVDFTETYSFELCK